MNPTDTYDSFATTFEYPITREKLIEAAGDTRLEAPTGSAESIADVLDRADRTTFRTPRDLHETILAHLGEQYVGRKHYCDRGPNPERTPAETI